MTAIPVPGVRDPKLNSTPRSPWGYLLHTTGGGVTDKAKRIGKTPIAVAFETYIASQNGSNNYYWGGPGYVVDFDGTLYQLAPDTILTNHCGASGVRAKYFDGSWISACSPASVAQWQARWPGRKHPYSLFPSTSPNVDYVGCEMIPIGDGFGGAPRAPGLRFTQAQHDAAIVLGKDLAARHGWPADWAEGSRLLGHEDVDPISRHDAGGGWDPGWLRASPYFDFEYVRRALAAP